MRSRALPWLALLPSLVVSGSCGGEPPPAAPAGTAIPPSLAAGRVREAVLAGGESHLYHFTLPVGRYTEIVVDQLGADVAVTLVAPGGRRLTRVDTPNGTRGEEPVPVLSRSPGVYRLEVRAPDAGAPPGRYALLVRTVRPATARDRTYTAAERTWAAAEELRRQGSGPSLRAAAGLQRRALSWIRQVDRPEREVEVLYSLGRIHLDLGEREQALGFYLDALARFRRLGWGRRTANTLNSLSHTYQSLGRPEEALACAREALTLQRAAGARAGEGRALNNLGRIFGDLGQVEEAFDHYRPALAVWRELGARGDEGVVLTNMGRLYAALGQGEQAIAHFRQALPALAAAGLRREEAAALGDLAVTLDQAGRSRDGLATLERALELERRLGNRRGEAVTLNNLGLLHARLGEAARARRVHQQALVLFRRIGDRPGEAAALHNLGDYGPARALFAAIGDRDGESKALAELARAHRRRGDLPAARRAAEAALARIESLRGEPASHELRTSFAASRQDVHELYVALLMELHRREPASGYDALALGANERARARSLLDALAEGGGGHRRRLDPALLAREAEAGRRLDAAARRADRDELRRRLAEYERVQAEIRRIGFRTLDLAAAHPLDAAAIRRQVTLPGTVLLEYALGAERSFLWVVAADGIASFELPPRRDLERLVRRACEQLARSRQRTARSQARLTLAELSRVLLAPAADRLDGGRLLIVPDGALHYLPFAALPDPAPGDGEASPLAERSEIVTLPSASLLPVLRRQAARRLAPAGLLAVVADPVFEARDPRVRGGGGAAGAAGAATSSRGRSPAFERLPYSRQEAAAILRLVPADRQLAALDFGASREAVLSGVLSRFRVVHFATHGVLDAEHPELSGIALSMVDDQGRQRNGFVRVHDLHRLDLPADLVVLSACRTALGREVRGEGLVGLTHGFLRAGARRVLVSLWPVDDQATTELMSRFYEELLVRGRSPAAALRAAQAWLRRQPGRDAPYFWAGFVLQGD